MSTQEAVDQFWGLLNIPQDLSTDVDFSMSTQEVPDSFNANVNVEEISLSEVVIYFAQTPVTTAAPTASEIINETAVDGVFWNIKAPLGNVVDYFSYQRTSVENNVYVRVSGVPVSGADATDVFHSQAFSTYEVVEIEINTGEIVIDDVDTSVLSEAIIPVSTGAVAVEGVDGDVDATLGINVGTASVAISDNDISVGGSTWIDVPINSTDWVNI